MGQFQTKTPRFVEHIRFSIANEELYQTSDTASLETLKIETDEMDNTCKAKRK